TLAFYTLALHDALPICETTVPEGSRRPSPGSGHDFRDNGTEESTSGEYSRPEDGSKEDSDCGGGLIASRESTAGKEPGKPIGGRSEEHTSELQSRENIV